MADLNLTQDEARTRAELLHVDGYDIDLDLTAGPETFRSQTTVTFDAQPGSATFIDAVTRTVRSIVLNGVPLDPATASDGRRIQLTGLAAHNVLSIDADAIYSTSGEGLHRFVDPVDQAVYLYSQFEVPDAQRMYACFDQPDLKARYTLHVTAPSGWSVISNSPTPVPAPLDGGRSRWDFAPTAVLSTYLTALIAGPYAEHRSELTSSDGRIIPLGAYCRASLDEYFEPDEIFTQTRRGFDFYEHTWNIPYPFEKYDQIFVPDFNAGAMENAGAVTFTETYVFRSRVTDAVRERRVVTILHELAHMWFGDLVTMRWWNDLWLNESFAEFISTLATAEATEWTDAWATFASGEKTWAYSQDQLPSTHPIVADIPDLKATEVNFDGITYAKGASVLKSLVAYVGREQFFTGAHAYFEKHAYGNTTLTDLLEELEAASGRDLRTWSRLWLESAGVNTLRLEVSADSDGTVAAAEIVQTAPDDHPTLRPHRIALGLYEAQHDALAPAGRIELDVDGARTPVPQLVGRPQPDLILLNDGDLAYAKVRFDARSQQTISRRLHALTDPLSRAVAWGAVWDATRDREIGARDYVDIVLANIAAEDQSTTLHTVLSSLAHAVGAFVAPEARDDVRTRVADTLWTFAQQAEPGSDQQFQFLLAFIRSARTPEHTQTLRDLRDGRTTLPGVDVDTDLDWELLLALCALDAADEDDIAAALADDPTASGRLASARAQAALPDTDGKTATALRVLTDTSLTNSLVRADGAGLQRVVDASILSGITEVFFAHIDEVWNSRSYHMIEEIIDAVYPRALADHALAAATEAWLTAHPDAHPALRRLLAEELDSLRRCLLVQERDRR
jgi:aminopeptidase N